MLPPCNFYWFRIDNNHMAEPWLDQALTDRHTEVIFKWGFSREVTCELMQYLPHFLADKGSKGTIVTPLWHNCYTIVTPLWHNCDTIVTQLWNQSNHCETIQPLWNHSNHCEMRIAIFAWRVTRNYDYSPFKSNYIYLSIYMSPSLFSEVYSVIWSFSINIGDMQTT